MKHFDLVFENYKLRRHLVLNASYFHELEPEQQDHLLTASEDTPFFWHHNAFLQ